MQSGHQQSIPRMYLLHHSFISPQDHVSRAFILVWQLAQPLLFALIGAEIRFDAIMPSLVGTFIQQQPYVYD